jgi:hypothetical protein
MKKQFLDNGLVRAFAGVLLLGSSLCFAQIADSDAEWVEEAPPTPPAFSREKLITVDMPPYVSVKVGVDPETIVVGKDGVVRYVVVMVNSTGSVSASFEGIRCFTDEFKVYARMGSSATWSVVTNPQWKDLTANMPSRHSHALARQGACEGRAATTKDEILKALTRTQKGLKPLVW